MWLHWKRFDSFTRSKSGSDKGIDLNGYVIADQQDHEEIMKTDEPNLETPDEHEEAYLSLFNPILNHPNSDPEVEFSLSPFFSLP